MTRTLIAASMFALLALFAPPFLGGEVAGLLSERAEAQGVPYCAGPTRRCADGSVPFCDRGACRLAHSPTVVIGCLRYSCPPPKIVGPITTPIGSTCAARPLCPTGTIVACRQFGRCSANVFTRPTQGCLRYECRRL
ncbi:MAG TPA: hypothetical protein PK264_11520 [Hyphomicrobiaceae bacterium]|nr:hypothetical protein [Hyphomicrobiaceae bacterium]